MKRSDWLNNDLKKTIGKKNRVSELPRRPNGKEVSMGVTYDDDWLVEEQDNRPRHQRPPNFLDELRTMRENERSREYREEIQRRTEMQQEAARRRRVSPNHPPATDTTADEWRTRYLQNMQNANGPFDRITRTHDQASNSSVDNIDLNESRFQRNIQRTMRERS